MQSGSEDPEVANVLQKCEEYVPGKVHCGTVWYCVVLCGILIIILNHFDGKKSGGDLSNFVQVAKILPR